MTIKVMVVDDSAFMRKAIKKLLEKDSGIEVVETARNGNECIEKLKKIDVDVITMDVEMPLKDGIVATKEIMETDPIPIIMLSSTTSEGSEATLKALSYGAIDFVLKPSGTISLDIEKVETELISKIKMASKSKLSRKRESKEEIKRDDKKAQVMVKGKKVRPEIVLIGSSTGGPKALQKVIPKLPELGVAVVVVQHMPKGFTQSLASSLDLKSKMKVKELAYGEKLEKNIVYITPGGQEHTVLKRTFSKHYFEEQSNDGLGKFHIPSVDVMLESIAEIYKEKTLAVMLTGMGNDGLEGFKKVKEYGAYTIAESKETAVIYGMPKVVAEAGLVDEVVPLDRIAFSILKRFQ